MKTPLISSQSDAVPCSDHDRFGGRESRFLKTFKLPAANVGRAQRICAEAAWKCALFLPMKTILLLVATFWLGLTCASAAPVAIATDGKALQSIVIAANASDDVKQHAQTLAAQLARISDAHFEITTGDGNEGMVVGLAADFPQFAKDEALHSVAATDRENYLLRSHADGLLLLGSTELAVRHAVWDLLHRLGYRQYFPGRHWEFVPHKPALSIDVDALERPAYHARRIWYGFGAWDYAKEPYREWCEKNRCVAGIELHTGHAYDGILNRNQKAFTEHPEYLGLVKGERRSTKFCISNPGLRKLVAADALAQFDADPARHSISIDPSDGGGWCECAECARLGSVTDRAVTLANTVAEAVTAKYPDKLIGMYAYSQHSPPPNLTVHPSVVISVATSFIQGGFTVDQLMDGWSKKATMLGIREYYSVNTWDRDLPGSARGGDIDYLRTTISHFHEKHARFLSAESSDNWGPNGLGYFLAARMLWDVREADKTDALTAEFLANCFGAAREPMVTFYELLHGHRTKMPLSDDLVGRMYLALHDARGKTSDAAVHARLNDLTLYTRYVELWLDYSTAKEAARQHAFELLIKHAYRMRTTMMIHTLGLYRDLDRRDTSVTIPDGAEWNSPQEKNPWKSNAAFTREELDAMSRDGIANRKRLDFDSVAFSRDLVRPTALKLPTVKTGSMGSYSRQPRTYHTWVDQAPQKFSFTVKGGIIYTNRGVTKLDLYPLLEPEGKSVAQAEVEPDQNEHEIELATSFAGLHRIEIVAGGGATATWPENTPMTIESSAEHPARLHTRWTLYFYVPRGTKLVGGFSEGVGSMRDGSGRTVQTFAGRPGYYSVPVPPGEDGKLWSFYSCAGDKTLMTVPPFLARNTEELLLPREVVEKDSQP